MWGVWVCVVVRACLWFVILPRVETRGYNMDASLRDWVVAFLSELGFLGFGGGGLFFWGVFLVSPVSLTPASPYKFVMRLWVLVSLLWRILWRGAKWMWGVWVCVVVGACLWYL